MTFSYQDVRAVSADNGHKNGEHNAVDETSAFEGFRHGQDASAQGSFQEMGQRVIVSEILSNICKRVGKLQFGQSVQMINMLMPEYESYDTSHPMDRRYCNKCL